MNGIAGRRALVTGAGNGIGRTIARALAAARAAHVMVADIDPEAAERGASEIGSAMGVRLDVTDAAATATLFAGSGPFDIVCANAGISIMNRVVDLTEAELKASMAVNAKGVFLTNQAAVRQFLAVDQRGGAAVAG